MTEPLDEVEPDDTDWDRGDGVSPVFPGDDGLPLDVDQEDDE